MIFRVIDKTTGKEPTAQAIEEIAKEGGLILFDIDQFYVGEDGRLVLVDDCGRIAYCNPDRFAVVWEREK